MKMKTTTQQPMTMRQWWTQSETATTKWTWKRAPGHQSGHVVHARIHSQYLPRPGQSERNHCCSCHDGEPNQSRKLDQNVENLQIFSSAYSNYLLLLLLSFGAQPCWFALYQWRTEKGWLVTCLILTATHSGLVRDVNDTDYWAHNGSTHGGVFAIFPVWF